MRNLAHSGFTLLETMMGASILALVIVSLAGAFVGQSYLNANARNLTAAMNDATQIMEQIRQQNMGASCTANSPSVAPPGGAASWNAWMANRKSVQTPNVNSFELVEVTCQDEPGTSYCGDASLGIARPQVAAGEWKTAKGTVTSFNPIRVTVAIGWVQQERVNGGADFIYTPPRTVTAGKSSMTFPADFKVVDNGDGVIRSSAMLTTLVTCR